MRYEFGRWIEKEVAMDATAVRDLCVEAAGRRARMAEMPQDRVMSLLARVRDRWASPQCPQRIEALERLPGETGFSRPMVEKGLDAVCWTLDPKNLRRKVATELGSPERSLGCYEPGAHTWLTWHPLGVVLHVLAGNVFVGAVGSLVEGLITGNVNILKMSSSERVFLPLLMRTFQDVDDEGIISSSIAVVDYASSQTDVVAELKRQVDAVVVWGGEEAVRAYREGLPASTRLIVFGPKLSVGLVTKAGLERFGVDQTARHLAAEVAIWDQNACTAPQSCYVLDAQPRRTAHALAEALGRELDALSSSLPPGDMDEATAIEIRKLRTVFEITEAVGDGELHGSVGTLQWTVLVDPDAVIQPSPLGRTLRIVPIHDFEALRIEMDGLRGAIQSVGLAAGVNEEVDLAMRLARAGAVRVMSLGQMSGGEVDDPHDGAFDLPQLMHRVVTRVLDDDGMDPVDLLPPVERGALLDERLRVLLEVARRAPTYAERLRDVRVRSTDDLPRVPILTRGDLEAGMPPRGQGLCTGPYWGGYVSRSGGSTGEPKFSVYDGPDWEHLVSEAVRTFRAMGLRRGDRLANFMLAGDLYGSFVSFDHINVRVGVTSFCFASSMVPEVFVPVWRDFKINVVQGVPSTLVPFLRAVKAFEPEFQIEKVIYAGSPMTATDRQWIQRELGARRVSSVVGANDGGAIAFQCDRCEGSIHHVLDDFNYVEIVDDEGKPCPDGVAGRLLITSLLKHAFPLIRYEIGDLGRIVPGRCPCSRTSRRMEHLGRGDDLLCVGMLNVALSDVATALSGWDVVGLQVAATVDERGESLEVRVEVPEPDPSLTEVMRWALVEKVAKLEDRLHKGDVVEVRVTVHAPGTLPRNSRTGKLKGVVDER